MVVNLTFDSNQILEEAYIEAQIQFTSLLPTQLLESEGFGSDNLVAIVIAIGSILVILVAASTTKTGDTP